MRRKIVMTKSRINLEEKYGKRCREQCYSYVLLVISGEAYNCCL